MAIEDIYQKGCDAVERANYDYAIELFREVLRQEPEFPDARLALRGTERRRRRERSSALSLVAMPFHVALTQIKAVCSNARKKLEVYEDFLVRYPDSFWGLIQAADVARGLGFSNDAAQVYRDALRMKPENKRVLRDLSDVLKAREDTHEALKYLERLFALKPKDRDLEVEVRNMQAADHMATHKMAEAESFRDLMRDGDLAMQLESDGRMAVSMDDLEREVAEAEKDVAEHPDSVNRILGLARLYRDTKRVKEAHQLLRQTYERMPDNFEVREMLGDIQLLVYDQAIAAAQKAAEQDAGASVAQQKKQELDGRKFRFAVKEYTWRIEQHPTDRGLQLDVGRIYFGAGQYDKAIAAFQEAVQGARFEEPSAKLLGQCFMQKGQFDLALEQFERAGKRHPLMDVEGKDLRYCCAQAYEGMGRTEEALNIYKRIYTVDINFRDVARKVEALNV